MDSGGRVVHGAVIEDSKAEDAINGRISYQLNNEE